MRLTPAVATAFTMFLFTAPLAQAQRAPRAQSGTRVQRLGQAVARAVRPAPKPRQSAAELNKKAERAIAKQFLKERTAARRQRANFFKKITVQKDYTNEYVFHRSGKVTAFLDISDSQHPAYDPNRETGEDHIMANIPKDRRAHVLVVPNTPREHITPSLDGQITSRDLKETLEVLQAAEGLAKKLGIKNAQVYMNPESRISIGYLHVHIVGEKPSASPYPAAFQ